jgi:hypothetical protein
MDADWLTKILPFLNAAGIPLLSLSILLLILSYRRIVEVYKDTVKDLRDENKRLSERLREVDSDYFEKIAKMKEIISKSENAVAELYARKAELQSKEASKPETFSDTQRINQAIELLLDMTRIKSEVRYSRVFGELEYMMNEKKKEINKLADEIDDTESRVIVIGVLTTEEAYKKFELDKLESSARSVVEDKGTSNRKQLS